MIPLDIYHGIMDNKIIETPLEAWLTFMACDEPERIIELITRYTEFKPMYETLYQMCLNVERVMEMFSEELRILDKNTVKYMIEEQQQEIDRKNEEIDALKVENEQKDELLEQKDELLEQQSAEIEALKKKVELLQNKAQEK